MDERLINLYELFSDNDQVVYKAVINKKDWMFRHLYLPLTFDAAEENGKVVYPDLFSLMNQTIRFKKHLVSASLLNNELDTIEKFNNNFNEKFRVVYFHEKPYQVDNKMTFFVSIDFTKLDDKAYKDLMANFFPCFKREDLDFKKDSSSTLELLKSAMLGNENAWCLILDKQNLLNDCYYTPNIFKKILVPKNMDQKYISSLKQVSESLDIPFEVIENE